MGNHFTDVGEQQLILRKMELEAQRFLASAPEGALYVSRNNGTFQYRVRKAAESKNGTYLKKKDIAAARALAQKDYCQRFLECAERIGRELSILEEKETVCSASFMYTELANVYLTMPPGKRELVEPYVLADDAFVEKWLAVPGSGLGFKEGTAEIYAERGERVRSKSEKMIADKLFMLGVPYRYEDMVVFDNGETVCPDFTILDVAERKEILFEHFGLMADEDYQNRTVYKMELYNRNGYELGRDFLFTMETADKPLDMRWFERMIRTRLGITETAGRKGGSWRNRV